ncbi:sensor histidine kinase [Paenibacillus hexagrammi]|uniref:histidine kinase n=1 Tax=Paenibacillus hexagrammi TaxID=2908839 RepID=A0ABY3SK61_9BACL|nr:ATP-binding protein [Paenibacillus sp. YPD9-1]UJF34218.1 ATP-binding protein [Paenibacillus sp. YPD9-1]
MRKVLILYVAVSLLFIAINYQSTREMHDSIQTVYEYGWGDSDISEADEIIRYSTNDLNAVKKKLDDGMWIKFRLPQQLSCSKDCTLFVSEIYENYEVYIEGERIYSFGNQGKRQGWNLNLIPLEPDWGGKPIYFRIHSDFERIGFKGEVKVDEKSNLVVFLIKNDIFRLIIPILTVAIGIFFLILAVRQKRNFYYIFFALFLMIYTNVFIARTYIKTFLWDHPWFWLEFRFLSLYIVPVLFTIFIERFLGTFPYVFRFVWITHLLLFAGIAVSQLLGLYSVQQFYDLFDMILLISMIIVICVVVISARHHPDNQILAVGFITYMLFGMYDVLVTLNLMPYQDYSVAQYGLFVLIVSILHVHLRRYVKVYQNIERYSRELAAKNEELLRLSNVKDEFLANTSHELRTPLNGIIGIGESILDGIGGPIHSTVRSNLDMMVSSAKRLSNLINDILDYSKLKHRELELQKENVELKGVVHTVVAMLSPLIRNKELEIVSSITDNMYVTGDENRIQQILYNLVGNAIKFTEQGQVRVSAKRLEGFTEVRVSDTGPGIPADRLESIFQSFEQLSGSDTRKHGGTGLGLSVTKYLVELHGGTIEVTSDIGKGTTFSFKLPTGAQADAYEQDRIVSRGIAVPVVPYLRQA